ncbi:methionyl-tRNA formyltransferase [Clostridiales bacterium]|nr:methionyl-tRNA formyltransferase [Clostridiales bacterium]
MNIVFMGTPDFAVPCLEKLIKSENCNVLAVFTQPDKKVGRKQLLTPPPVKVLAVQHNIPVYQPVTLKNEDAFETIRKLNPDLLVVVAYGKILPKPILDYPKFGCINVHASLLPKYRGAAPIQWAVLNGDKKTGVCVQQMDIGIDTGDILFTEETDIGINETSEELFERLSVIGADALIKTMDLIIKGQTNPVPQPAGDFGYASMIDKSMSNIDWSKSAFEVHNQIRGLQSWPCASTVINGKNVKVHKSVLSSEKGNEAGKVVNNKNVVTVSCGDGNCIDILELQPDGKKRMDAKSFLAGNKMETGQFIGE